MSYWVVIYRVGWFALVALGIVGASVAFVPKWKEYREYQRRNSDMVREEALEQEMINLLKAKQERFTTDPRFVVRIAHDLGLARSNEVIFRFQQETPVARPVVTNPPPRPAARPASTPPSRPSTSPSSSRSTRR